MANSNLLKDIYSLMTRVDWGVLVLETTHAMKPLVKACSNSYSFLEVVKPKQWLFSSSRQEEMPQC
jgi:hypothetical protein